MIYFEKGCGFTNPYKHILRCLASGDKEKLNKIFNEARQEKSRSFTWTSSSSQNISNRNKCMYSYLRMVVLKSLPLSIIEDKEFRTFSKYDISFSRKAVKSVIFKLYEIVEHKIKKEIASTKGAIMYDAWTKNQTHFIGVFATYMREKQITISNRREKILELAITLLSVSPIASGNSDEDIHSSESPSFTADDHVRHFNDIFTKKLQN